MNPQSQEAINSAVAIIRSERKISPSLIQRRLRIGYARAIFLIDDLERLGYVGPANGAEPRDIHWDKLP